MRAMLCVYAQENYSCLAAPRRYREMYLNGVQPNRKTFGSIFKRLRDTEDDILVRIADNHELNSRRLSAMTGVNGLEIPVAVPNVEQGIENKIEYHTDEEELSRETDWIVWESRKSKNKKRKAVSSPETSPQQQPSTSKQSDNKSEEKKTPLPPPVNVVNIAKY
ncbi:hypothetical protein FQA39_LY16344 [Lamprigera yunnana]|nr:hypothetical protein FQA39_LY16344 [Lamprigera yunnana]